MNPNSFRTINPAPVKGKIEHMTRMRGPVNRRGDVAPIWAPMAALVWRTRANYARRVTFVPSSADTDHWHRLSTSARTHQ